MRLPSLVGTLFGLLLVFSHCGTRSSVGERFSDSQSLTAPALTSAPSDPDHFSFAIVGDLHVSHQGTVMLSRILTAAAAEGDSFIALLGDMVDGGAASDLQAVSQALGAWQGKSFAVIGNHDVFDDGWSAYRSIFGPSHYTFTAGHSRFIVIDSADGTLGSDQSAWLKEQLAVPNPGPVFVLSHYLPVVPGERTYLKIADEKEARSLMKLSSSHRVTAWLGGHYHSYCVGDADGVSYVVAGGGGGRRMDPVTQNFFVQVLVSGGAVSYQLHLMQ